MEQFTLERDLMVKRMDMVNKFGLMEVNTMDNGKMIKLTVMESSCMPMEISTKVNG
jgi:hypothetical protein